MIDAKGPIQFMQEGQPDCILKTVEKSSTSGKFSILSSKIFLCAQLGMVHGRKGNDDGETQVGLNIGRPSQSTPKTSGLRLFTNIHANFASSKTKKRCCPP